VTVLRAAVLERAGRIDEAREELERALAIWEQKGCLPCAQRIREQLGALEAERTARPPTTSS
jgi:predicted RNA polymerase sigma factor